MLSRLLMRRFSTTFSAIGRAEPLSVNVDTHGTGKYSDDKIQAAVLKLFDLRPKAIIDYLGLKAPIYLKTASGGHYGRVAGCGRDGFQWERTDKAAELVKLLNR